MRLVKFNREFVFDRRNRHVVCQATREPYPVDDEIAEAAIAAGAAEAVPGEPEPAAAPSGAEAPAKPVRRPRTKATPAPDTGDE